MTGVQTCALPILSAAGINFLLNMIFIPRYGFIAAAYTTMISYGLLMIFHYIASCCVAKRKVYRLTPFLIVAALAFGMGTAFNLLYDKAWQSRYSLILLMTGGILFFMRKEIKEIVFIFRKGR